MDTPDLSSFASAKSFISAELGLIGLAVDFSPIHKISDFPLWLEKDVTVYIDLLDLKIQLGDRWSIKNVKKQRKLLVENSSAALKALSYFEDKAKQDQLSTSTTKNAKELRDVVKNALQLIKLLKGIGEVFGNFYPEAMSEQLDFYYAEMLFYKNELDFSTAFKTNMPVKIESAVITAWGTCLALLASAKKQFSSLVKTADIDAVNLNKLLIAHNQRRHDTSVTSVKKHLTKSIIPSENFVFFGKGAKLQTLKGPLVDLASMTVNCILGQNDPWVRANQMAYIKSDSPSFHSSRLGSYTYFSLPERLVSLKIGGITPCVVNHRQCNGSDTIELAVKAAYNHRRERSTLVSFTGSYHGQNLTADFVSSIQNKHKFLTACDNVAFLDAPSNSQNIFTDELTAEEIKSLNSLRSLAKDVYAIIIEPIQVNHGVNTCSKAFLTALKEISVEYDICLIYDEVQTGFGWLGKLSAAEVYGVSPSILCLSKSVTSGSGPLAITVMEPKFYDLTYGTAEKTNGADLRSLTASGAVLDRLVGTSAPEKLNAVNSAELRIELKTGLLKNHHDKVSKVLDKALNGLRNQYLSHIAEIRGFGLIRGIPVLDKDGEPNLEGAAFIKQRAFEAGVFFRASENVLIIKPPLVITESEVNQAFKILSEVFLEYKNKLLNSVALKSG